MDQGDFVKSRYRYKYIFTALHQVVQPKRVVFLSILFLKQGAGEV